LPYSDGGAARFELSSVALQRRAGGTSNVNGLGASLGPSGLCWFTYGWQDALAGWLTPPTPTLASARALSTAAGAAGMAFEVSGAPADWSALHHLTLQGSFPVDLAFVVQAVTAETPRGCTWNLRGQGTGNYVVELQAPDSCWGTPTFDLRGVSRVEIQVQSGVSAELQVSSVALD